MARIRKFAAYRSLERPYTRKSKYKKQSFIKTDPHLKITKYETGAKTKKFDLKLDLVSKSGLQIRHDALESARQTANRLLEKAGGSKGYFLKVQVYPHHMLRENPLATGAGADRLSTGMKMSFGKVIGAAARVMKGQTVITASVDKPQLDAAKKALVMATKKLPSSYTIVVSENLKR